MECYNCRHCAKALNHEIACCMKMHDSMLADGCSDYEEYPDVPIITTESKCYQNYVNNVMEIRSMLKFLSDDEFYTIQIIKRRKENPDMKGDAWVIKTVYVRSLIQFDEVYPDLMRMADFYNARIYINLNVKSFKKALGQLVVESARRLVAEDFEKPHKIFDSVVGSMGAYRDSRWLLDIDTDDLKAVAGANMDPCMETGELIAESYKITDLIMEMCNDINECEPTALDKIVGSTITPNGLHVILKPFNPRKFTEKWNPRFKEATGKEANLLHKNAPTILYANIKK